MSTKKVIFSNPGDVIDFVKIVEKYPFDMDMKRGRYIVDAVPVRSYESWI